MSDDRRKDQDRLYDKITLVVVWVMLLLGGATVVAQLLHYLHK